MALTKMLNNWPGVIPTVGQVIQVRTKDVTCESTVRTRSTKDGETYFITIDSPYPGQDKLELFITPNASAAGLADRTADLKPFWRIPSRPGEEEEEEAVDLCFIS